MRKELAWGALCAVLASVCAAPASAKVVFTGYGDFQVTPQSVDTIGGPPSILNADGFGPETITGRATTINALGLFATTNIDDKTKLMMDVTYKGIGATVKTLTIQYGFVEYADYGATGRLGKITLPFNYYNQNRFYPFQHASISAPVFQSAILGLPIADLGATIGRPFDLGHDVTLQTDVYAVNGFGSVSGSTTTFRNGGVLSSGLSIANNIGSSDGNHDVAFGGRLELSHAALPDSSAGLSYYHDRWDPAGRDLFQMGGAHLHVLLDGFDSLTEYLALDVKGDAGMVTNFGSTNWRTDGFFTELDYVKIFVWKKQLTPWVRYEDYMSHAVGGGTERERLTDVAGGLALKVSDGLTLKAQASDLFYRLPYQDVGDLTLQGYSFQMAATVTF